MESNVVWSERFTLNLPPEVSRDKSELDYLRRTNKEAWEAAPKPRLMPATARKRRPLIVLQSYRFPWTAEYFESSLVEEEDEVEATESDEICDRDVRTPEDSRRDSGVEMDDDEEMEIELEVQNRNASATECSHCRRDSGISMDDERDQLYEDQSLEISCCCDNNDNNRDSHELGEDELFFEDDVDGTLHIDEAMIGLAV